MSARVSEVGGRSLSGTAGHVTPLLRLKCVQKAQAAPVGVLAGAEAEIASTLVVFAQT